MTIEKKSSQKVAERLGEIIEKIQRADNQKKNHWSLFLVVAAFLIAASILVEATVETTKTTKAFEQREFGRIINQTGGLDVK